MRPNISRYFILIAVILIALPLAAQTGEVDTTSYLPYVPAGLNQSESAPVLLLMDPRGRARVPLELYKRAADEFGYLILSSYRTLSDDATAFAVNERALAEMLRDATDRFNGDSTRIYLVGFSGTAHYAWIAASDLDGKLAGIVGVGGGLPAYTKPIQMGMAMRRPFSFFAVAGIGDFNYDGVRWLDEALDTTRVQHRFVSHDGRHQWHSEEIAFESVRWFELQAIRSGAKSADRGFLLDVLDDYMKEARRLEDDGDKASAYRRYREIVADFEIFGLGDDARDRFERLAADPDVHDELRRRDELSREVQLYKISVRDFWIRYGKSEPIIDHDEALERLRVSDLQKQARDRDYQTAGAAKRMLASAHATCGFYGPRDYLKEGRYDRALSILRLAEEIYGRLPRTCYMMAQSRAQLGQIEDALSDLECAIEGGWPPIPGMLESDPLLDPLRDRLDL